MMTHTINCDTFDDRLSGYLEGELSPGEQRAAEAHLASCLRCTALVRDLDAIRADAGALPELSPSSDLWDGIARRIEAPVVPLAAPAAPIFVVAGERRRRMDRVWLGAIAAALVAVTAGVTYMLTIATSPRREEIAVSSPAVVSDTARLAIPDSPFPTDTAAPHDSGAPTPGSAAQNVVNAPNAPTTATYSREIDRLRTIFTRNRNQLDPRTAAIIEANLKLIDDAIAQSRAALAQDPASRFLNDQLNNALDKKLELLKTAALLPQRT